MIARQFPFYRQHDTMECGATCLRMICKHYGKAFSSDYLSGLCQCTTQGVSLLGISRACQALGIHAIAGKLAPEVLEEATLPCILHWNQNHFVVLYRIRKGRYYLADPGKGLLVCSQAELRAHWLSTCSGGQEVGIALFLEPTPEFFRQSQEGNEAHPTERSFSFLLGYIRKYRRYFGQIVLGLLVGILLQLLLPFLTQSIVDVGIKHQDIGFIWLVLLGQFMLIVSQTALDFVRRWLLLHINLRINISLLSDFFVKLLRLPMSFFDTKMMGDLMQRMSDHGRVNDFLTQQTLSIAFSMLTFVVFSVVLLFYHPPIFGIFLVGSVCYVLWMVSFLKKRKVLDYELFEKRAQNNNTTYEFITSMQEIKLQDCQLRRRWEWEDVQTGLFEVQTKVLKLQQTQEAGSLLINQLKNMVITVISATAVINGQMTLGMMLAVQYIIGQLNSPVDQLMAFCYSLQDVRISLERINEIHQKNDEDCAPQLHSTFADTTQGIVLSEATFMYDIHASQNTIDHLNLHIPAGKVTAIVGASGSGKTTLIKLLLGYYELVHGEIFTSGVNLSTCNKQWWRRQCGVVMQEGVIFSESIARNIAVGDEEIDPERLLRAAEIACIKDYVLSLPLQFNTRVGRDGVGLSQGQKQRILIARAVYRNPQFIFLDEATNSLDAHNERRIVENLSRFYQGKTVVVVAHRLSTVKHADQIVVLDDGRVVEIGNHQTLTARKGAYYTLVKNQLELGN